MPGGIQARGAQGVLDEGFVGQRLQRGAGFAHQHEQGMGQIDALEHAGGVIRVHVADEAGFHFEAAVLLGPVFQGQVHGPGAQIAAADADLHHGGELFTLGVGNFAAVHPVGEIRSLLLLGQIERALIHAVRHNGIPQLAPGELMQHQALFAGIDDLAVVQRGVFLVQLSFPGQLPQRIKHRFVHLFGGVVVLQTAAHGHGILRHPAGAGFPGQHIAQLHAAPKGLQIFEGRKGIQVFPGNHGVYFLSIFIQFPRPVPGR